MELEVLNKASFLPRCLIGRGFYVSDTENYFHECTITGRRAFFYLVILIGIISIHGSTVISHAACYQCYSSQ